MEMLVKSEYPSWNRPHQSFGLLLPFVTNEGQAQVGQQTGQGQQLLATLDEWN